MKRSYEGLFAPGFHDISILDLEEVFLCPFEKRTRRKFLIDRFKVFLGILINVGAFFEIWIDGSFATRKEEPDDIDIGLFCLAKEINSLKGDKEQLLRMLLNNPVETKLRYHCDTYFVPLGDHEHRSYWRGWFGFDREEKPKGIPRMIIGAP